MSGTLGILPPEWQPEPTLTQSTPPRRDGTDIARYQWHVDADLMAAAGVTWWAHKVSGPMTGDATQLAVDPFHSINRAKADAVPFRTRLGYHFLGTQVTVAQQAAFYLNLMGAFDGTWQPMLDVEGTGVTEPMALEWCDRVEQVAGLPVHIYSGVFVAGGTVWKSQRLFDPAIGRARILAAYTSEDKMLALCATYGGGYTPDVWQFLGNDGRCPGVGRLTQGGTMQDLPCDNDQVYDWAKFDAACGWGHA